MKILCRYAICICVVLFGLRVDSFAEERAVYYLTKSGEMYMSTFPPPATDKTMVVRSLPPPWSGYSGDYIGLIHKDGYFYAGYRRSDYTFYLVRFGLTPGDQVVVGQIASPFYSLATKSDGSVWIAAQNSSSPGTQLRQLNLSTLSLGSGVTASPQFNLGGPNGIGWDERGMTFDSSDRLVLTLGDSFAGGIVRLYDLTSATWVKNCGILPLTTGCWYSSSIYAMATDSATGKIYAAVCGSSCQVRYLTLPENPAATRVSVDTFVGYIHYQSGSGLYSGMAIAPAPSPSPFDEFYYIGHGIAVPL